MSRGKRREDGQPDLFGEILPDEAGERSRATMWDVCRFVEAMLLRGRPYKAFVVENVEEVQDWLYYPAWQMALRNAGYCLHPVHLNSMFAQANGAPAPQSRDRWYCIGHLAGNRCPDLNRWLRPPAWCPRCDTTVRPVQAWKRADRQRGRYGQQYAWRCPATACRGAEVFPRVLPAAVAIDWSLAGTRIGDRVRPLAPKTVARIDAGLRRYAHAHRSNDALLVPAGGTWNDDAATTGGPFRTRTTRETEALVVPVEGRDGVCARRVSEPARTQTARLQDALLVPLRNNGVARPAGTAPAPTVAAAGNHHALVMRNMTARGDQGQMCTPMDEPLRTILAEQRQSLVRWDHLLVPYYGTAIARRVSEPASTVTTVERHALVGPAPSVDDCLFRMLEPHEIQLAMAFPETYVLLGNKRERVRMCGNAVTPPAARDLVFAVVASITGES
jgi:DNA (cytosine-5)-methyltransferase 1